MLINYNSILPVSHITNSQFNQNPCKKNRIVNNTYIQNLMSNQYIHSMKLKRFKWMYLKRDDVCTWLQTERS